MYKEKNVNENVNKIRRAALDSIERNQKMFIIFIFFGALIEAALIAGFLLLADFSNRLHLLILIATITSYSIIIMGLFALGFYLKSNILRVLKAMEILSETLEGKK